MFIVKFSILVFFLEIGNLYCGGFTTHFYLVNGSFLEDFLFTRFSTVTMNILSYCIQLVLFIHCCLFIFHNFIIFCKCTNVRFNLLLSFIHLNYSLTCLLLCSCLWIMVRVYIWLDLNLDLQLDSKYES